MQIYNNSHQRTKFFREKFSIIDLTHYFSMFYTEKNGVRQTEVLHRPFGQVFSKRHEPFSNDSQLSLQPGLFLKW